MKKNQKIILWVVIAVAVVAVVAFLVWFLFLRSKGKLNPDRKKMIDKCKKSDCGDQCDKCECMIDAMIDVLGMGNAKKMSDGKYTPTTAESLKLTSAMIDCGVKLDTASAMRMFHR